MGVKHFESVTTVFFFFCDDVLMRGTASATEEVQQIALRTTGHHFCWFELWPHRHSSTEQRP